MVAKLHGVIRADVGIAVQNQIGVFRKTGEDNRVIRAKQQMLNGVLEDMSGSIGIILFPKNYLAYGDIITADRIVRVTGRVMINDDAPPEINVEKAEVFVPDDPKFAGKQLFVRIATEDLAQVRKLKEILRRYPGDKTTRVFIADTRKQYSLGGMEAVKYSDKLLEELNKNFGAENIVLK